MVIIKQMLAPIDTNGARSGLKLKNIIGITIHNTDNWSQGAGAMNHASYLQNSGSKNQASWHYAVDEKCITQSIPDNEVAWHAGDGGSGKGNTQTIAIEICVNPDSNLEIATNNAAELSAMLLRKYQLSAEPLYQHHDWMDKNCPSQLRAGNPYNWDIFKAKVAMYYNGGNEVPKQPNKPNISNVNRETGAVFTCTGLWTQANGGTWYSYNKLLYGKGDYTIGKVYKGAEHPYEALYKGVVIGFASDKCIDDEPTLPKGEAEIPKLNPEQQDHPKYGVGTKVTFTGLWTASTGGVWYQKENLLIKQGIITKVVSSAEHPYLINNGDGWANDACIDNEPSIYC